MIKRDLCTIPLFVIPAKAGIQETIDNTGFPPQFTLAKAGAGMTILLFLCSCAKVSKHLLLFLNH